MRYFFYVLFIFFSVTCLAESDRSSLFPLNNYSQDIDLWIKPSEPGYDTALMTDEIQKTRTEDLYQHYYGKQSPWNADYISSLFSKILPLEQEILLTFSNYAKDGTSKKNEERGYKACQAASYPDQWIEEIKNKININQFSMLNLYQPANRGIAITNLPARALPTEDAYFHPCELAGEGPPFDYLQMSAVWAGTPVYILGTSTDAQWYLVVTPDFIAWVKSNGIARINDQFVTEWTNTAQRGLLAITHTHFSVQDKESDNSPFMGYMGMIFPLSKEDGHLVGLIPALGQNGQGLIHHADFSQQDAVKMPLKATPRNMARIIKNLLGRSYGWGNYNFLNDCSAELKSLYAPFGIWLPRHSSSQVNPLLANVKMVDLTRYSPEERLYYLTKNDHHLMTIVYIGGHVLMYMGTYANPQNRSERAALSYQNMWGLRPKNVTPETDRRAIIGKAVLLPLLLSYPEDVSLRSELETSVFQVAYLDEMPNIFETLLYHSFDKNNVLSLISASKP